MTAFPKVNGAVNATSAPRVTARSIAPPQTTQSVAQDAARAALLSGG